MPFLTDCPADELARRLDAARADHAALRQRGLKLDMTRGKPAADQLDLAAGLIDQSSNGDFISEEGQDVRNYGGLQGLIEMRRLFAGMIDVPAEQIVIGENSSLGLMHDTVVWALLKGVVGSTAPWSQGERPAFICPTPGYDRHFAICEEFGIRMLPVPMRADGPDMDMVERLVRDPAVKGMWCVPKYSNPSGEVYGPETVARLARMPTGAADFRLFWDNAYAVHHLTDHRPVLADILALSAAAGYPDRAFVFASTSKVTLAGAGLACFGSSPANVAWFLERTSKRTVGPNKLNQIRHVRFLRDAEGVAAHMEGHRRLLTPKFSAVLDALESRLGGLGIARWTRPEGGYFISVDVMDGTARRVVQLAAEAGVALTPAGATWPGGRDPNDRELRLAPTFPTVSDVKAAAEVVAVCILLAALEAIAGRGR